MILCTTLAVWPPSLERHWKIGYVPQRTCKTKIPAAPRRSTSGHTLKVVFLLFFFYNDENIVRQDLLGGERKLSLLSGSYNAFFRIQFTRVSNKETLVHDKSCVLETKKKRRPWFSFVKANNRTEIDAQTGIVDRGGIVDVNNGVVDVTQLLFYMSRFHYIWYKSI